MTRGQAILVIALLYGAVIAATALTSPPEEKGPAPTFGRFLADVDGGKVRFVELKTRDNSAVVRTARGEEYTVGYPPEWSPQLVDHLQRAQVSFDVAPSGESVLTRVLRIALPIALILGILALLLRRSGQRGVINSFRRAPARQPSEQVRTLSFADVAGVDEAVEELHEIKEFLENPKKFQAWRTSRPRTSLPSTASR